MSAGVPVVPAWRRVLQRALEAVGDNPRAGALWRKCVAFEEAKVKGCIVSYVPVSFFVCRGGGFLFTVVILVLGKGKVRCRKYLVIFFLIICLNSQEPRTRKG